jgi:5-methyltetrahydrofolate--homocysteine methyltransferase
VRRSDSKTNCDSVSRNTSALDIINNILLDGMKVVGDLFGAGQMQLPFVLQSAEAMKAAVRFLEPYMEKKGGATAKGTMVLATVKGDVHDIGKNLVDIILTNNGYRVLNLGIKQPIEAILQASDEHGADAIGMSGLLVKSTLIMRDNLELMNERGVKVPVVLGGAALTRRYVEDDLKSLYKGPLFYARDAFAGLHTMDLLVGENGQEVTSKSGDAAGVEAADDVEDLIGEEAKLGIRKSRRRAKEQETRRTPRVPKSVATCRSRKRRFTVRESSTTSRSTMCLLHKRDGVVQRAMAIQARPDAVEEYQALVRDKVRPIYEELKERRNVKSCSCRKSFTVITMPVRRQRPDRL